MKRIVSILLVCLLVMSILPASFAQGSENGGGLSDLAGTKVVLAIGGNQITKGKGFLKNIAYITEGDMEQIYANNSGEATYKLGLGDSFVESVKTYSAYENHGTPEWLYRRVLGLDIETMAAALGIDTNQVLSVAVSAADGTSKVLADGFQMETKRYYYDTTGAQAVVAMPILALYETSVLTQTAPGPDSETSLPKTPETGANSPDRVEPLFGYGQTAMDEITNCYWVKYVNKLRIGPEDAALAVTDANGKRVTSSLSSILLHGIYQTTYTYDSKQYSVMGLPLETLLAALDVAADAGVQATDTRGETVTISKEDLSRWFVAWSATYNGSAVSNATALQLYGPDGMIADLTDLTVTSKEGETAPGFSDLEGYGWAEDAIDALYAAGVVKGTSDTSYSPGNEITRGDFMLMLYRAYGLTAHWEDGFADVAEDSYYYEAIAVCKALGIAKGDGEHFHPTAPITRQDAMVLLHRCMTYQGIALQGEGLHAFSDGTEVSDYAMDAVGALVSGGIIQGSGGMILPMNHMTRAEMAVALYRGLQYA